MYKCSKAVLITLLLLSTFCTEQRFAYAQTRARADKFFDNYEYSKAIPLYKRSAGKNDADLKKLADCYRLIKNYWGAEICYGKLASKKSTDPKVYYYYGEALLNNNKYEEAKKQFTIYSILDSAGEKGDMYAQACDEIKILLNKPSRYKVYNLGEINSEVSDFSPVFYKGGIVFASERIEDLVNFNKNNWTGNSYLTLIYSKPSIQPAKIKSAKDSVMYEKGEIFYKKFYGKGPFGPACFNSDFSEMFFTKADVSANKKNGRGNKPKLYWAKYSNGWEHAKPMPFNSSEYATGHPALSKDGQYLYFASDMPGGQGGSDIWVSKREGDSWSAPKNLGPAINTKEDESFPYISSNNTLYFSSNGHKGYGGLDLFSAVQKNEKWENVNNLMPPINSTSDDFGILLNDDNSGYFSSNRIGGKGGDDLYGFIVSGVITNVSGKILLSNKTDDGAQNVKVFLVNDKGSVTQTTSTDDSGLFKFESMAADQHYNIKVDESDPNLVNQKKFYLADTKNKIVRSIVKSKDGFFIFENLPPDFTKLSELKEEDPSLKKISIAGNMYADDIRTPVENTKVSLVNDLGEIIQTTMTNSFGSFVFMNIESDKNFTVVLDDSDPALARQKIYFTNKSGKEISTSAGSPFRFSILATDKNTLSLLKVEDSQLLVNMNGTLFTDKNGKSRVSNSDILLLDEKGNVVSSSKTDAYGNFKFINLHADKSYMVKLKTEDPALVSKEVFLADSHGKIMSTLKLANGKIFRFTVLPSDEQSLITIYFDDPWLKVSKMQAESRKDGLITIIENVYYDYHKWTLMPRDIIILNKVIDVMKANEDITINILSHTDSRGTNDFNMKLSQKRARTAVDYMVSKGIERKRLNPIGKGETELVNRCKDGVDCSEEEHAQNRRTEFVIKNKIK